MNESDVFNDPGASEWLRTALRSALACDPVRAANDASLLHRLLQDRLARLAESTASESETTRLGTG